MDQCYFTKNYTPPWVFLTFFKFYKTNGTKSRQASYIDKLLQLTHKYLKLAIKTIKFCSKVVLS